MPQSLDWGILLVGILKKTELLLLVPLQRTATECVREPLTQEFTPWKL